MLNSYFAGIGSNVDPARNVALALEELVARFGPVDLSRIIRTAPVGPMSGMFLNAVAHFQSDLPPDRVKEVFCGMEEALGRDRSDLGRGLRDRTLDLDILLALPKGARTVDAAAVPAEFYYRSSTLELLHVLGFGCAVPPGRVSEAVEVPFRDRHIGPEPTRLLPGERMVVRRAALVTGGAVRVGKAMAATLARAGYDIALHFNASRTAAEQTANELRALGVRCELFCADFSFVDQLPRLLDDVLAVFPHLELLLNSASVYDSGCIAETTPEMLDRQWCVNFKAPFLLMREFHNRLARGTVVNILDNKIAFNQFHYAAYLSSKKALAEATKMAALEFAPRFRVNGIAPGVILPASVRDQAYLQWRKEGIPVGRLGHPAQVCQALEMLIANDFVNGQILFVDGGEAMNLAGRNAPLYAAERAPRMAVAAE